MHRLISPASLLIFLLAVCSGVRAQTPASCVVSYQPGGGALPVAPGVALGAVDQLEMTLGDEGELVLAFGRSFLNGPGDDLILFPRGEDSDSCQVFLSVDGQTFTLLGTAAPTGDTPVGFDFSLIGFPDARFVKLVDLEGGGTDGYALDGAVIQHPAPGNPAVGLFQGTVMFPDGQTPAPNASVQLYEGMNLIACDNVDGNGAFSLNAPPGSYQVVVVYPIPVPYVHPLHTAEVFQPADLDLVADVVVSNSGQVTPPNLSVRFNWPTLMLHGTLAPKHVYGPFEFTTMQPYLASDLFTALNTPREAFLPIEPLMSGDGRRTYREYFLALRDQRSELLLHLNRRFTIVGYSQGGLVARRIVSVLGGQRVDRVVLIGTANRGTCVGDDSLCTACDMIPYVCPLRPSVVEGYNASFNSGFGVPFYLVAGSFTPNGCSCLQGEENDGFIPVNSVFYLDSTLFPDNQLTYNVVEKQVVDVAASPPLGSHHYKLRRDPPVLMLVQEWLSR